LLPARPHQSESEAAGARSVGIVFNEHTDEVPARPQARVRGHRVEAARVTVPVRTVAGLVKVKKAPGRDLVARGSNWADTVAIANQPLSATMARRQDPWLCCP
jgi:hypothetical protein